MAANKKIINCIGFMIVFIISYWLIGIVVIDDNCSTRLTWHEFYTENNIDIAMVGNSRVYRGFDPQVADEKLGGDIRSFNLGTSSQTLDGSYYVVKELIKRHDVQTIFLDVEYSFFNKEIGRHKSTWLITDYMKGITKVQFITDVCEKSEWSMMFSRICRYRDAIGTEYCLNNLRAKMSADYWSYQNYNEYYDNYQYYQDRGFTPMLKENAGYDFWVLHDKDSGFDILNPQDYNEQQFEYLYKTIELCQKNDIELILITMPETNFYISRAGEYAEFTTLMNQISKEYEVPWYDFNLLTDENFVDAEFANLDHLTADGAKHFTEVLCEIYLNPDSHTFSENVSVESQKNVIGVLYVVEHTADGKRLLTWDVHTTEIQQFQYVINEYAEDGCLINRSEQLEEASLELMQGTYKVELEIYDDNGQFLGNGYFWKLERY